jgi:hypothetical protein
MIWNALLPDLSPCLFPYREGCWKVRPFQRLTLFFNSLDWMPYTNIEFTIGVLLMISNDEAGSVALD